MSTKCIIIDDEPLAINVIKNYLQQIKGFEVTKTFSNALEVLDFLKSEQIDVMFLDINMPLFDGLSFVKALNDPPLIIVTTAYTEFAVETYELNVLDYLVKPIEFPRFIKAINKVEHKLRKTTTMNQNNNIRKHLFIKIDKKKMKKIYLDEILTVESLKDYLRINTTTGKYIIHSTLSDFTALLPKHNFIRIHRSYTIAIDKIDVVEGNSVEIEGLRYVIGRSYLEEVKSKILNQ
ncbi:DNA-binding response regulator [Seonamhaeicola sp. S2-3]|uniref:LytR/AlgR family response regulator transcription factor n=1 Tax=Seonamhaeicola sp. S2-3 TaxID=1936081 RepID=UPI0009728118|nr:response regulator transcription factor [Seonamhaeicola sp. S2-3]APY11544.1 DNA-binding response regulator [Seonamhaeicola sp. S2-3]